MPDASVVLTCESDKFDAAVGYGSIPESFVFYEEKETQQGVLKNFVVDSQYVFDGSVLPNDVVLTSAFFSYEADDNSGQATPIRFQFKTFASDGVWDVDGPSNAEWRAFNDGAPQLNVRLVNGQDASRHAGGTSVNLDMRKYPPLAGATVGPVHEVAFYFKAFCPAGPTDIESVFVKLSSPAVFTVTLELREAIAGGGGAYNLMPGALIATAPSFSSNFGGTFYTIPFNAGTALLDREDYCIVFTTTHIADEINWLSIAVVSGVVTDNDPPDDPVEGSVYGQDEGLTFTNYPMKSTLPAELGTGLNWTVDNLDTFTGQIYSTETSGPDAPVDLKARVQESIDEWVPGGPKRIALYMNASLKFTNINFTDEDGARQNPQLHLAFFADEVCFDYGADVVLAVETEVAVGPSIDAAGDVELAVDAAVSVGSSIDAGFDVVLAVDAEIEVC